MRCVYEIAEAVASKVEFRGKFCTEMGVFGRDNFPKGWEFMEIYLPMNSATLKSKRGNSDEIFRPSVRETNWSASFGV